MSSFLTVVSSRPVRVPMPQIPRVAYGCIKSKLLSGTHGEHAVCLVLPIFELGL